MAVGLPIPPSGTPYIDPRTGTVNEPWQRYLLALSDSLNFNVAPIDGRYWIGTANGTLTSPQNLGLLSSGYLKITTSVGVATPSTTATIPVGDITGTLAVSKGGTGIASYAVGDLVYASGATTLTKLPDVATGSALISGGIGVAPSWGKVGLTTHVSGTLPVGNGGTGAGTFTVNGVLFGNTTGALQVTAQGGANTVLAANAGAPAFTSTPTVGTLTATNVVVVTALTLPADALGAGAPAALGLIGGTGPTVLTQQEWVRIATAGGTRWIPAWL